MNTHPMKLMTVIVCLAFGYNVSGVTLEVPHEGSFSGFGHSEPYRGQTFFSPDGLATEITFYFETVDPHNPGLHLLITEINDQNGIHPTTVLFESGNVELPIGPGLGEPVTVDLGGVPLKAGQKYAWILDAYVTDEGGIWSGDTGMAFSNPDPNGEFIRLVLGPFPSGTRAEHFALDWTSGHPSFDMSYILNVTTLTISPASGTYVLTQAFDLTLIAESDSLSVTGGTATLDSVDVSGFLGNCVVPGTLISGGQTFRCPGITGDLLTEGTHTLSVTLDLSDGSSVSDSVTWDVVANTEP